jgi:hypothetical protein
MHPIHKPLARHLWAIGGRFFTARSSQSTDVYALGGKVNAIRRPGHEPYHLEHEQIAQEVE